MAWAHFFGSNSQFLMKRDISFQMKIPMIGILEQNHTLLKTLKRSVISTQQSYAGIERRLAYTDIVNHPVPFLKHLQKAFLVCMKTSLMVESLSLLSMLLL